VTREPSELSGTSGSPRRPSGPWGASRALGGPWGRSRALGWPSGDSGPSVALMALRGLRGLSGAFRGIPEPSGALGSLRKLSGTRGGPRRPPGPSGALGSSQRPSGAFGSLRGLSGAFGCSWWPSGALGILRKPSRTLGGLSLVILEALGGSWRLLTVSAVSGWLVAARWHFARCFADNARTTHGQRTDNATDNAAANTPKTTGKTTKINDLVWQELKAPSYIKENNIIDPAGDFGRFVFIYYGFAHVVRSVVRSVVRALSVRCPCVVRKTSSEMTPGCHEPPRDRRDREEPPGAARSFQKY
jgi:hypothetical protein